VAVAALAAAGIAIVRSTSDGEGGGRGSLSAEHASLTYEGDLLGERGTTIHLVVDGDDLLEDRRTGERHRVTLIRGGTTYDCPLDGGSGVCVRSDDGDAATAARAAVVLFVDPLSEDGTFGAAAKAAQAAPDRTVAGRRSTCSTVAVAGRPDPYEVCRDADLGFLTSAKGRDLDLVLTSIRAPRSGEVEVPKGVPVEGEEEAG
jgi:hypothetical protein